jgi:hypothetical protein
MMENYAKSRKAAKIQKKTLKNNVLELGMFSLETVIIILLRKNIMIHNYYFHFVALRGFSFEEKFFFFVFLATAIATKTKLIVNSPGFVVCPFCNIHK